MEGLGSISIRKAAFHIVAALSPFSVNMEKLTRFQSPAEYLLFSSTSL